MTHYDVHGVSVPALGFGTYQLRGGDARDGVEHALALGYRHIDTAQIYENEAEVGAGLAASDVPRDDVFLTTKVWRDRVGPDRLADSLDESLKKLGTDYVDLLLLHWPVEEVPLADQLGALDAVRQAGKARLVGVSNYPSGLLAEALGSVPDLAADQVEYHALLGQDRLLATIRERGMVLTAYSPLAQGALLKREPATEAVHLIAAERRVAPAQIALAWLLGQDRVTAIPKAASADHREANLAAAEIDLSDDERIRLDALPKDRRQVDPDFGPDWDA